MEQTNETSKRPVFLTVLCILTWVGSAIGLAGSIGSIGLGSSASVISLINLLCIVACALGAFMMWQLKKTGFYIYTAGELIPVVASIALLGSLPGGGFLAGLGVIAAIIPVAFVVMYAVNLKHMK